MPFETEEFSNQKRAISVRSAVRVELSSLPMDLRVVEVARVEPAVRGWGPGSRCFRRSTAKGRSRPQRGNSATGPSGGRSNGGVRVVVPRCTGGNVDGLGGGSRRWEGPHRDVVARPPLQVRLCALAPERHPLVLGTAVRDGRQRGAVYSASIPSVWLGDSAMRTSRAAAATEASTDAPGAETSAVYGW